MNTHLPPSHPQTPLRDGVVLGLPPQVPRRKVNPLIRGAARQLLKLAGWRMEGAFPDVPKAVLIGAPHSSNWDGIWGFAALLAMGLDLRILAKKELFWGPLGWLLRKLGVIAIDRSAPGGFVVQSISTLRDADQLWIGIAPEGTRKRVEKWKTGFWKLAQGADVPVIPMYFHYPDKVMGIGQALRMSDDMDADMARLREWYRPWIGRNRDTL